jgi:putative transposase
VFQWSSIVPLKEPLKPAPSKEPQQTNGSSIFPVKSKDPSHCPKQEGLRALILVLTYVQCSDGSKIDKPRFFKEEQKALAKAQRKFSKFPKELWDKEKQRAKLVVARVHERIKNKREDFCHKASKKLIDKYDMIAHEDLNVKGMLKQKKWSKSIADASWSTLIQYLTYKAENAGRIIRAVDPRGTSQRCSQCGTVVPKSIDVRVHHCPHCGFKTGRDLNSALEILRLGMQSVDRPLHLRKASAVVLGS